MENDKLIQMFNEFKRESSEAKVSRMAKDEINFEAYLNKQDFSNKVEGQSTEFIPKVSEAVETLSAFIKRALVAFGDWFEVELEGDPAPKIKDFFKHYLLNRIDFIDLIVNGVKSGLLRSLIITKTYSVKEAAKIWKIKNGDPTFVTDNLTMVKTELIHPMEYFPDPTGKGLYEIHSVEKDFYEIKALADKGFYDIGVVDKIKEDFRQQDEAEQKAKEANQDVSLPPVPYRRKVKIDEYWGSILNEGGEIEQENISFTIANEKYIIRKPETNRRLDGESPFTTTALISIPFSVWHRALFDDVVQLNFSLNELFNLMIDGGLAAVWGIKQLRVDDLKDPSQVSDGIVQGTTLLIKSSVPYNAKVLDKIDGGDIPQEALALYNILDREFQAGSRVNDVRGGMLPFKAVKATEIMETQQSSAVIFDSFISTIEKDFITEVLYRIWNSMLQISDIWEVGELMQFMNEGEAIALSQLTPQERYDTLAGSVKIRVYGLSAITNRAREFQKLMALLNVVSTSPILGQAFMKKYDIGKVLDQLIKSLNINPENLKGVTAMLMTTDVGLNNEQKAADKLAADSTGDAGVVSEINRAMQVGGAG